MIFVRTGLAAALLFPCACLWPADAPHARETTITLRTWDEGPADPTPQFQSLGAKRPWYPYPLRLAFGSTSRPRAWRALEIENEYLSCVVLPDLGGHLYNCRDKVGGFDLFHANPSLKKADIALRGAWAAFGVELNFPIGHSLVTVSPVDWAITSTADSASVWVGATDRVTGMRWRVEFALERGVAALRQHVILENQTEVRRRYYWWTNAGVTQQKDTQLVMPTRSVSIHGTGQIDTWPVSSNGQDRSSPASYPTSLGLFAQGSQETFLAAYHPATRSGTLHYADPVEVPGKKTWVWGRDADREIRSLLSDDGSLYLEIQAGTFPTQETFGFLEPGAQRSFTEYWMPVHSLDGISQASRAGVLWLGRKNGAPTVEFLAARELAGARIRVAKGAATAVDEPVSVKAGEVLVRQLPDAGEARYSIRVSDSAGKEVLAYNEGELKAASSEAVKLGAQPPPDLKTLSLERALYNELQGELTFAANDYRKLSEQTLNDVRALKGAGRIAVVMQRFDEAQKQLAAAVQAAPQDAEAHYYLGVALAGRGDDAGARREWAMVHGDRTYGRMATIEAAAARARQSTSPFQLPEEAPLVIRAAFARLAGSADASGLLRRARALDPTDSAARFEEALEGGEAEGLWEHLAANGERVLDIADLYMHWGLYNDAEGLLDRSYPSVAESELEPGAVPPGNHPLIAYYLAYCRQKQNEDAEDYRHGASELPVRYVFPNRASSRDVLEAALRANTRDATARYLLSLWMTNAGLAKAPDAPPKASANPSPASAPPVVAPAVSSPTDIAATALMAAAVGDLGRARSYFTAQNFPGEKQDDSVRAAYIELELQRLLGLAAERKCPEVDRLLTNIGAEDKSLPFTFHPFNALMRGARFQYYLGEAEAACVDEKSARKRWDKVAHMKPDPLSPDFAYPYMAAARLSQPLPAAALEETRRRLQNASDATRAALLYSQGLLLLTAGQKEQAHENFVAGQQAAAPGLIRYLNTLALH
jgi:hypothetical protein